MPVFRKKPVKIEAIQFTGKNYGEVFEFAGHVGPSQNGCKIVTLEGIMEALPGDWIIKGVKGEFYPCKPDIFEATYEPVLDPNIQYPDKPDTLGGPFPEEEA